MIWVRIHSTPVRQLYQDARALPFLDPKQARHALLVDVGTLKAGTGTENATMTLTLQNRNGECSRLFASPPLGAQVDVYQDGALQFTGTFDSISLDATCRVGVVA